MEPGLFGNSAKMEDPIDLSSVPEDYHEYADVFSKGKADTLPPHHPSINLKIDIEDGCMSVVGGA